MACNYSVDPKVLSSISDVTKPILMKFRVPHGLMPLCEIYRNSIKETALARLIRGPIKDSTIDQEGKIQNLSERNFIKIGSVVSEIYSNSLKNLKSK